ncbi:MAG: DUF433 domain-containing protein [Dehalococcoidia bacterium]|nr:DUF433 domain-containing protein [Dehalococcoidia bacterium]
MSTAVDIGTLIVQTVGVLGGRPRIAGTRISVATITMLQRQGVSPESIAAEEYPHLSLAQIYAALAYYHANRRAIDDEIEAADREYEALAAAARQDGQGLPRG